MFKSWRLGRVLGFPVEINLSFILLLGFVLLAYGGLPGLVIVGLAFGSVLLHELGHAVVARKLGVHVSGIELSFFGGAAKMTQMPRSASDEIAIAAAGPAVSLVLGGLGVGLGILFQSQFISMIGWINFVIAGFNMIPALPMDGGRILRAALAYKLDYVKATDVAVVVARVVTIGFVVIGLAFSMYQLLLLAPFLWMMTSAEQRHAHSMADRYVDHFEHVEPVDHRRGWGSPFDPAQPGWTSRGPRAHDPFRRNGPTMRRYAIVQRDGRLVIEAID
jgi:Zn-dependent protease